MPCQTGRAGHTLLKKDCQSGCACCVNTAYSCGMLKCNEINDNSKDCNTFADFICRLLIQSAVNQGCENATEFFSDLEILLPAEHPRVLIEVRNATQDRK